MKVSELILAVRRQLDETNEAAVGDSTDILPALNRAQDVAANILARHYEAPMLVHLPVQPIAGQQEYRIPEDAFEQRLEKVEVYVNQVYYPVKRISYRDITLYETPTRVNIPYYYCVVGDSIRLLPTPTATYPLRIWYLQDPPKLVPEQGRVVAIGANYLALSEQGEDISTEADSLQSFVNIVDGQSGRIKATMQVLSIEGNRIYFRGTPSRTKVHNRKVSGTLPSDLELDDLVCLAEGACIPIFQKPFSNYLIEYAVAEITRKLGGNAELEMAVKKELETIVERSWVGREQERRVTKRNKNWAVPTRRYFSTQ